MSVSPLLHAVLAAVLFGIPTNAIPAIPATHEIVASKRAFTPPLLSLPAGQPVTLIVRNEDEELHAFVPLLLFKGLNVQLTGNGAPEFNETGFARVLIPPHGRAEIRTTLNTPGTYSYLCDLPGHNMRGVIVVQAPAAP
jgi:uncharacterized cupredoxin-like copper-binding protein